MPSPTPLTSSERKLCYVIVGAVLLITAMPAIFFGLEGVMRIPGNMFEWLHGEWQKLLAGRTPKPSLNDVASGLFTCTAVGTLLVLPLHCMHLLRRARWMSPATLWFWTIIYGFFPAVCGGAYFYLGIALLRSSYGSETEIFPFSIGWLVLGIVISIVAFRAWRRRRREEKAARIMEEATE